MKMKKLFQAIRKGDIVTVRNLIEKKSELIACVAKQPPKKDDGQSPLQVALKTGQFDIITYLLDKNADVNFMESEECCNEWRAPVIHDAINMAVMNTRWNVINLPKIGLQVMHSKEDADRAYHILRRILESGADINAVDSYGNTCAGRVCAQACQILPSYNYTTGEISDERIITEELSEDLHRIFNLLYEYGMKDHILRPDIDKPAKEYYGKEPVARFLR